MTNGTESLLPAPAPRPTTLPSVPARAPTPPGADGPGPVPGSTSRTRFGLAVAIAVVSDLASVSAELVPPVQVGIDLATAGLLYLALGRSWFLLPGLVAEAIPGVALFPSWILVVSAVGAWGGLRRPPDPNPAETGQGA